MNKAGLIIFISILFASYFLSLKSANGVNIDTLIVIDKTINKNEFNWEEETSIGIKIRNLSQQSIYNIKIEDYIPSGFEGFTEDKMQTPLKKIQESITELKPEDQFIFNYKIVSQDKINSEAVVKR